MRQPVIRAFFMFLLPVLFVVVSGCSGDKAYRFSRNQLGTVVNITVIASEEKAREAAEKAFHEIERIENLMSPYRQGSDVSLINEKAGKVPIYIKDETFQLLKRSKEISAKTWGAFDITFAPLGEIWNYKSEHFVPPSLDRIIDKLRLVGHEKLLLHPGTSKVSFFMPGMKIGLGGIAKGYAVHRAMQVLIEQGVRASIVEEGGDLQVYGMKHGKKWRTGIMHPGKREIIAVLELDSGQSIATSGNYERFAQYKDKRYSHIIDPRTGKPADTGLVSVSVVSSDPVLSDALATALTVLGKDGVRALQGRFPGTEFILINDSYNIFATKGLKGALTPAQDGLGINWLVR